MGRNIQSLIPRSIVDHNNFETLGNPRELGEKPAHHALDITLLVMRGEKDAEPG